MPRGKLSQAHKDSMQAARVITRKQRDEAHEAISQNPQFQNPKFWSKVDADLLGSHRQ